MFTYVKYFSFLVKFYQLTVKCPFKLFGCSLAKLGLTACNFMDCSTPGFSVLHRVFCSNSCPLSQWCHPTMSFSIRPFFCLQSFPSSRSFPMRQLFISAGQIIGASAPVLPKNIQGWFPLGWTSLISFLSKGLSRVFSSTTVWKHQFFGAQPSLVA